MTGWLLDTNVVSETTKSRAAPQVITWLNQQPAETLWISVAVIAELRFGVQALPAGHARRGQLDHWLERTLRPQYADRVLPLDEDVMLRWMELVRQGRMRRQTVPEPDLLIAATASVHGLTIVTRNVAHFAPTGVPVFNPWQPRP